MKYYTKLELRYTTHGEIDENGYEDTNYYNHILTSKLFETEKEAINIAPYAGARIETPIGDQLNINKQQNENKYTISFISKY